MPPPPSSLFCPPARHDFCARRHPYCNPNLVRLMGKLDCDREIDRVMRWDEKTKLGAAFNVTTTTTTLILTLAPALTSTLKPFPKIRTMALSKPRH